MKNFLLFLFFFLSITLTFAQTKIHPELTEEEQAEILTLIEMDFPFELADEQIDQIIDINVQSTKLMQKALDNAMAQVEATGNVEDFPKEFPKETTEKAMDYEDQFYAVLTQEQIDQFEAYKLKMRKVFTEQLAYDKEHPENAEVLRGLIKEIKDKETQPIIEAQRLKLDKVLLLEMEDYNEVEKIRVDQKRNRDAIYELNKNIRTKVGYPDRTSLSREEYIAIIKSSRFIEKTSIRMKKLRNSKEYLKLQDERETIEQRHIAITEKYVSTIEDLIEEIKPQQDEWRKRTYDKWDELTKDAPLKKVDEKRFWILNEHRLYRYRFDDFEFQKQFILMDVARDFPKHKITDVSNQLHQLESFPNPAKTEQTISFTLKQDTHVLLELVNHRGITVIEILNEEKTGGDHEHKVNVNNIPNGIYVYRLTTNAGESTCKFMKVSDK